MKPNNIALTKDGHVRLIDFGMCTILRNKKQEVLPKQTAHYCSPEVWNKKPAGLASDWWSYGVIIAYLYQLRLPFEGDDEEDIQEEVLFPPNLKDMYPYGVKKFIMKLLEVDPEKRLSKVSKDEFFGLKGDSVTQRPFKPRNIEIPPIEPSADAEYFTDDPTVYDMLEGNVIRIPPPEFFASEYYKLI